MTKSEPTLARIYAALIGVLGLGALIWLFEQAPPVDLATLLAFAVVAVLMSYFRVPVGLAGTHIGLDGAVLLSATLAGGPALGGWASFAAGLVTGIAIPDQRDPPGWGDRTAQALLNGGTNVLASLLAWLSYEGMNGNGQTAIDGRESMPVLLLCLVYALVRYTWTWPYWLLHTRAHGQPTTNLLSLTGFALEFLPLPAALLTAATFVHLGWAFFLLLVLVYVGLGAIMRQMLAHIVAQQEQIEALDLRARVCESIGETPLEISKVSKLACTLCQQVAPADRFELGLYDLLHTQITIQVSAQGDTQLPAMRMPVTPLWEWLSKQSEPQRYSGEDLSQLPFTLPPFEQVLPRHVLFVPLVPDTPVAEGETNEPTGGIVLQSAADAAYTDKQLAYVAEIAKHITKALSRCQGDT
jgi:hypothetical protein